MQPKLGFLILIAGVCLWLPLMRFFSSPTWESARAVDIVLVFAAGTVAGALITAGFARRRTQ